MAWDDDKATAADPDNPAPNEQLTADEWDAHVTEGHFPADELNFGVDSGDPVLTDPQNADEIVARYDRGSGTWDIDAIGTGDQTFAENSSMIHDRDEVTATTATTDGSGYYLVDSDAAGAAVTLTLASADAVEGRELNIKRDGNNDVTVDTEGSETIDGSNTIELTTDQEAVTLVYNSADSDWEIW